MNYKFYYPIERVISKVSEDLRKYPSPAIYKIISSGKLNNEIKKIDIAGRISNVAEVIAYNNSDTLEMEYYVVLSMAYCQYLWILCDISLRTLDYLIYVSEVAKLGMDLEEFVRCNDELVNRRGEELIELLSSHGIDPEKFRLQAERINPLLKDDKFHKKMGKELMVAFSLLPNEGLPLRYNAFRQLNMFDGYGLVANSCCLKGVSFILLHELNHVALDHFSHNPTMQDEKEADSSAFWTMYLDSDENEKFTVGIGIICTLFSLVIKDFGSPGDNVHPREDIRLFEAVDNMISDNQKYGWMVIYLFNLWASIKRINDFPEVQITDPEGINKIKEYFSRI